MKRAVVYFFGAFLIFFGTKLSSNTLSKSDISDVKYKAESSQEISQDKDDPYINFINMLSKDNTKVKIEQIDEIQPTTILKTDNKIESANEEDTDIKLVSKFSKENTKIKIEQIDEIQLATSTDVDDEIQPTTILKTDNKIESANEEDTDIKLISKFSKDAEIQLAIDLKKEAKVDNSGFARNYYVEEVDPTTWESIAYTIDYLKSSINLFGGKDSGFYGNLGLIYTYNTHDDAVNQRSQSNFKQEYSLGYRGVAYSSKLLKYSLFATIRYEDIEDKINNDIIETKAEGYDYKVNLDFLRHTKTPFTINATKMQKPTYTLYRNNKSNFRYDDTSLGLNGLLNLKIFQLNYSALDSKGTYEDIISTDYRKNRTYRVTLTKKTDIQNIRLYYDNTNQIIDREKINSSALYNIGKESINLYYRNKLSSSVKLDAQSSYRIYDYSDSLFNSSQTKSTLANLNLSWSPVGKHHASIGISGSDIKDLNKQLNTSTSIQNINLVQSYGYRMSKNINISQSLGYNIVFTDLNTMKNINFNSGINYRKKIATGATLSIFISAGVNNNSSDANSSIVTNNMTTYLYAAGTGINQALPGINSRLNIDFKYNGSTSNTEEARQSYGGDLGINTNIYSSLRNQFKIKYYNDTIENFRGANILISTESSRASVSNEINHATMIGTKGTLNTKIGIEYLSTETNGKKIDRLMPKADIVFRYRLGQKLNHISRADVYREVYYDTTNYSFASDFIFETGKLSASIGYIYNKIIVGNDVDGVVNSNVDILDRDIHRVNMKFNRRF
ncbi:MAG: hypothetical protein L3I99_06610 [Sulfurimonas sp.]|nr:hypothetical protein [Sulfurimonas sp.]